MNTYINAIDYYLPESIVQTRSMVEETKPDRLGFSDSLVEDIMGIREVRHAADNEMPSQLATKAAKKALAQFDGNPDDIGVVIFCGIEGDYVEPSTAHIVQNNLGLKNAICFDVSNACLGFMTGINVASAMLSSRATRNVLICTGERPSKISKAAIPILRKLQQREEYFNRVGSLTVGDAGAAVILGAEGGANRIDNLSFSSDGSLSNLCYYKVENDQLEGQMLMKKISRAILDAHKTLLPSTFKKSGIQPADIDCLITHQVGKRPWERYPKLFEVDKKVMTKTFDTLGNITSATFGVNYAQALASKRLKKGQKVMAAMAGSGLSVCQFVMTA